MKKYHKTVISAVVAVVAAILFAGTAPAEFYVIPTSVGGGFYNIVIVSHTGSDTESGTALLNALAGITGESKNNRYLIVIEPGTYDIGGASLQIKEYVDIAGYGEDLTTITGNISTGDNPTNGVVMGADDSKLSHVTVRNTGNGTRMAAVYNSGVSDSFKMNFVTAEGSGSGTGYIGVCNNASSPTMTNVKAAASGGYFNFGVYNYNGSGPGMNNVTTSATSGPSSFGVYQDGGTADIIHSDISPGICIP